VDDSISILLLISSLIDMAEQGAPQTSKEPKRKGFRNRLKKMFGRGTPRSGSTLPQAGVAPPVVVASPPAMVAPPAVGASPMPTTNLYAVGVSLPTIAAPRAAAVPPLTANGLPPAVTPANRLPPADHVPTASTITTDSEKAARLRAKYTHFRILVIGRANAGKTTLLKRVCNTKEDPVYSEVRYMRFALYPALIILSPTDYPNLKGANSVILPHLSNQVADFDAVARDP